MPKFNVSVDHGFDRSTAVQRVQKFSDSLRDSLPAQVSDVEESWDDQGNLNFAFQAMGFKIAGLMQTNETSVSVDGTLPFAALPFRGMIENELATHLRNALT